MTKVLSEGARGREALLVLGMLFAVLGVGTPALAFWSTQGAGIASAGTATLNAPTGTVATASSSTVTISWTGSELSNGTGARGYYLTRVTTSSGAAAAACESSPTNLQTITNCSDTNVGAGAYHYIVTAAYNSWTAAGAASADVTVSPASKLAFTTAAVSGTASTTANLGPITVQQRDTAGNPATSAGATTVTLTSTSTTGTFAGTPGGPSATSLSIPAGSSSATFYYGDTKAGTPTVTATATGLTSATQAETITAATASKLGFTQQPTTTAAGAAITPAPSVQITDQFGNPTTSTASVTVAIGTNPSTGTLSGTATAAAVNGTATFTGLSINKAAAGYTLTAASTGLTGATSSSFTITAAAASKLAFTTAAVSGTASTTANLGPITVQQQDQFGNPVPATVAGGLAVALSKTGGGNGTAVFSQTLNGSAATSVFIPVGQSSTSFYFGYSRANSTPTINASATGLNPATQIATTQ